MRQVYFYSYFEVAQPVNPENLGGLGGLRQYIEDEVIGNIDDPDLAVRGVMLVGVPGVGKSLAAKTIGGLLGWPILRMDVGKLKGSKQGESENNMAAALKLAEAFAPCVFWVDEAEKMFAGHRSSAETDGGTTLGMIGQYLTWTQEHKAKIISVATINDFSKLPAELTRAGRFDEKFFVDLPNRPERVEIASVHLKRFITDKGAARKIEQYAEVIADLTHEWSGAEIANLVLSAARRTRRQFDAECFAQAAANIKPDSVVNAASITALRQWGTTHLRPANTPETPVVRNARSIARPTKAPIPSKAVESRRSA